MREKKVSELMTKIEDYPRIPHSFTVMEAMEEFVRYANKGYRHILVFDEKFKLAGLLSIRDMLRNMEPKLFKPDIHDKFQGFMPVDDALLAMMWEDTFFSDCRKQMQKNIIDILPSVKIVTVEPDTPLISALYIMMKDNVNALPVMRKDVVIGVIRLIDIVGEILSICCMTEEEQR